MKAFEMTDNNLQVSPEIWGLLPFKKILKRDKSRLKEKAFKEMLFIYYYCDIRSDYMYIMNNEDKASEIVKDIGLKDFKFDKVIEDAVKFYEERSTSIIEELYKSTLKSAQDIADYLKATNELLKERTVSGGTVTKITDIVNAQNKLPEIMKNLKTAYQEVIKEKQDLEGRHSGNRKHNHFEEGL